MSSQQSIGAKKPSIINGILQNPDKMEKKLRKQHKKNKKTQEQPIVGLSEIFYPDFNDQSNGNFDAVQEFAPDMTAQ